MANTVEVTRTHLEMRDVAALRRSRPPSADARLARVDVNPDAYRAIYTLVGERWQWRDRLLMHDQALADYLASANVHIWLLTVGGEDAGYFELQQYSDKSVEIMYFGLVPRFMGQGLGGWMLTRSAEEAFALGARLVTLHTCTLDAPTALPNYLARGFTISRTERYFQELPA
ncbi:MAG: GNAT family N-acetyltransferase [Gemmatimonadaceae bacterium]